MYRFRRAGAALELFCAALQPACKPQICAVPPVANARPPHAPAYLSAFADERRTQTEVPGKSGNRPDADANRPRRLYDAVAGLQVLLGVSILASHWSAVYWEKTLPSLTAQLAAPADQASNSCRCPLGDVTMMVFRPLPLPLTTFAVQLANPRSKSILTRLAPP